MTSHPPTRWLAPLALLASLVAVLVLVSSTLGGGDGGDAPTATEPAAEQTRTDAQEEAGQTSTTDTTAQESGPRTYTVQPGDTLGGIADETGVPVERLQELNPNVDSQALVVGQTLRLRGGG
jgi:LysM repeat protein